MTKESGSIMEQSERLGYIYAGAERYPWPWGCIRWRCFEEISVRFAKAGILAFMEVSVWQREQAGLSSRGMRLSELFCYVE